MKAFHLSDLHIGKQLHGFSLIADQRYILKQILMRIEERKPELLLIAGDIYDKSLPSAEAVEVFDDFLTELAALKDGPEVCIVSGNHDSQERLAFGSRLFSKHKIHIAGNAPGRENPEIQTIEVRDAEGTVFVHMLPFFRPSFVREMEGFEDAASYEDAMERLVRHMKADHTKRNILLCHQFFTNSGKEPERSDSEVIHVGGQDQIDGRVVSGFDYVAAGHIHRPQDIGANIRYCGSPLKYSVSEAGWEKSITEVTLGKKGECSIERIPLKPLHDVRKIRGALAELTSPQVLSQADPEDYVSIVLTDEEDLYEPGQTLARVYPRMLEWKVENSRTRYEMKEQPVVEARKSMLELFEDFCTQMRGAGISEKERMIIEKIVKKAGGDEG